LRWIAVGVVFVAILASGTGGASSDESGDSAAAGEATQLMPTSDDGARHQSRPHDTDQLSRLTSREVQVVHAIADGDTTTEVAEALGITTRTVESHLLNAYTKLGVHSRVQLVRLLARAGQLRL
jgi:DNA-binding NarL/FixJ family response regulator